MVMGRKSICNSGNSLHKKHLEARGASIGLRRGRRPVCAENSVKESGNNSRWSMASRT